MKMNKVQPKNLKRALREKYKRRLSNLTRAVKELQGAAKDRLADGGKIRDKVEVLKILDALDSLKTLLPDIDNLLDEETNKLFCQIFNIEYQPLLGH
jgi:hypothetical protein